jgi:hypothetical protein
MGIVQYHNDWFVKEIMRAQVRRVGAALEYLEKKVVNDAEWINKDGKRIRYEYADLQKQWIDWIKGKHQERLGKLNKALDDNLKVFLPGTPSIVRKWDYSGVFSRAAAEDPNCGEETNEATMKKRVEMLVAAKNALPPADPVLNLD